MIPHDFKDQVWDKAKTSWWRILGEIVAAIFMAFVFYVIVVFAFALSK